MEETITALLAGVAGGRRHWVRAPQQAVRPFLVLTRVSGIRDYVMQGASGHVESRVQVDVYADSYTDAKTIARQVAALLSGHRAGAIQGVFLIAERDLPAEDAGTVNHPFRVSLDFNIHHQEN